MLAKQLLEKSLYQRPSIPPYSLGLSQPPSRSLYVSGLPDDGDDLLLYKTFGACGAIESVKVCSLY